MSWLAILALAGLASLAAIVLLKLPRGGYTLLGAALLFGLAGYATQGSPDLGAAPGRVTETPAETGELVVATRRSFYDPASLPSRFLITSDAYARRGDQQRAAAFAESAVRENPRDSEAWTALGIALSEHAAGQLPPAALHAFDQARSISPDAPAPAFFLGLAWLRNGEPARTRALWAAILAQAPADAPWREAMAARLARLDAMLGGPVRQE